MSRWRALAAAVLVAACAYGFVGGAMPGVVTGTWHAGGSLSGHRAAAAAVLLADGRVLITGGADADGSVPATELLAGDGSVVAGAPMNAPRASHSVVLLDDGRVLAVGGRNAEGAVASAELYANGAWTTLASQLTDARWGHTATLLEDGRVVIAGGENAAGILSSVEVFEPETMSFSLATGALAGPRKGHAATRLPDGRVLIAGGFNGEAVVSSIDVYNADIGSIAPLQDSTGNPLSLGTPRAGLSATTLLDGRVLFLGGTDGTSDQASGEVFNPAAGTIGPSAAAAVARRNHLVFLLPNNNAVLVAGGVTSSGTTATAELYLPWRNEFWATGSLSAGRASASGSALSRESYGFTAATDGVLVVAGGEGLASSEVYGFATVKTDVDDYAPGDQVYISGAGWQPGETVTLGLREVPAEHESRTFTFLADESGNIPASALFEVEEHHLGVRFYLTARGAASQAQTTFTDANNFNVTPIAQTVAAGSVNTFSWVFAATNSGNVSTTMFTVPAGWTPPQSTNSLGAGFVTVAGSGSSPCNVSLQSISGMIISIRQSPPAPATGTCGNNSTFTLRYANVTAPTPASAPQVYTFVNQHGQDPTVTVTAAANFPPVIAANNATVTVNEGQSATNTGTWSDANPGDNVTLTASVGTVIKSGTNANGTWSWSFPATDGPDDSQTVTITANDGKGGVANTTFQLTVNNVAPTVSAGADATIDEGSVFSGSGSFTDPGADTWTATVDYGNGGGAQTLALNPNKTFALSHTYVDNGTYTVTVTVTDDDGDSGSDTLVVTVNNVAPTVSAGADATIDEGSVFSGSGSFTDPGADTWTATVDYGDGGGAQTLALNPNKTFALSHTYADNGTYTVTVTVTDDDGDSGSDTLVVTVKNVAPTATLANNGPVNEGSPATIAFSNQFDPSTADTAAGFHYAYACDGSSLAAATYASSGTFSSKACTFGDNGTFTVRARIIDKDNGYTEHVTYVIVNNVAPGKTGSSFSFNPYTGAAASSVSFADPGWLDTVAASFDWAGTVNTYPTLGPGSSPGPLTGSFSSTRTFGPGCITSPITVRVSDDDGDYFDHQFAAGNTLGVHAVAFLAPIKDGIRNVVKSGNVIPVKLAIHDCNGNPLLGKTLSIWLTAGVLNAADVEDGTQLLMASSVSAADTSGIMRHVDGHYMYNLATKGLSLGLPYTIVVKDGALVVATAVIEPKK